MVDIRHTLIIEALPQLIYQALTTSEGLSSWWTPHTEATPETGTIARFPFADNYVKEMRIIELISNDFVKWHCLEGDKEWIGTSLTFKLVQHNQSAMITAYPEVKGQLEQGSLSVKTLLLFEHKNWKDYSPSYAECSYTWAIFLNSLKLYCETGKGRPWPTQHQIG
ncbi:SRPBCC domain-containing protein [Niabella yanshanensis]|uniref:SRPBCC domain-containing protein n=1 Tax=Niabella yanshanensis TaxID=577386 RepID=A0ABZ0WAU1_9BACT|nr:SRPBCC domain-containing protein [Niabella yanshanensis]WQD39673.1 SRPBCC domain-containing protein [Niabella yanshanensis]